MRSEDVASQSGLLQAVCRGASRITIAFGGQGPANLHCFERLSNLNETHGSVLRPLLESVSVKLIKLASLPHEAGFHDVHGFDILRWLAEPSQAPDSHYLALAPMSFPINTLISLCHYWITANELNLDLAQLRALWHNVIGHSQGIFAAAAISRAEDWESFLSVTNLAIQISFFVGLESHLAAPPSLISAAAAQDCMDHGEGRPSYMLSVSGPNRSQLRLVIDRINGSLTNETQRLCLGLRNSREKHVVSGPPQSLRAVCAQLRDLAAPDNVDESRTLFSKRKLAVEVHFLPISAPFHSFYLSKAEDKIRAALEGLSLTGDELGIPLFHTQSGKNLQGMGARDIIPTLVQAVTRDPIEWPSVCSKLGSTHILCFGPGNIGSLINETTEGTGVRVIQTSERSSTIEVGDRSELFSPEAPLQGIDWRKQFAPRLVQDAGGNIGTRTRMTELLGTPPIMVGGMTPTTAHWDVVSAVTNAGYTAELAGGGFFTEQEFETAIRKIAATTPAHRGIVCNLLYAHPTTLSWQVSCLRRLVLDGVRIEGITIGAGIPSPEVVRDYIQSMGLKHVSFKPGSQSAIEEVIEIARQYPQFPIGLQWTGGRAGGHHSYEDFHSPLIKTYARIRRCPNIVLIAGSGFGGGSDTWSYLSGDWSTKFGLPCMPFDGIMLGSRLMVAKEAQTSPQAKNLIVDSPGVLDGDWHGTFDRPTGGVITITSEMGQPIHMLATRGALLWKEFDQHIFSIRDGAKRLQYVREHSVEIISKLNESFQKPWFPTDGTDRIVHLKDMTYLEVLDRMGLLMYVKDEGRWFHDSWRTVVLDFVQITAERLGVAVPIDDFTPADLRRAFIAAFGEQVHMILYPEDVSMVLHLFRRRGQKPVPFIPVLDEDFETWFKKDSLWQSENVDAVVDSDVQRCCIIQGPVAVRYSTTADQTAREILDDISMHYVSMLSENDEEIVTAAALTTIPRSIGQQMHPGVQLTQDESTVTYEILATENGSYFNGSFIDEIIRMHGSPWLRACAEESWLTRGGSRIQNPLQAALRHDAAIGDIWELHMAADNSVHELVFSSPSRGHGKAESLLRLSCDDGDAVDVELKLPQFLSSQPLSLELALQVQQHGNRATLLDVTPDYITRVCELYSRLWIGEEDELKAAGMHAECTGEATILTEAEVRRFNSAVAHTSPLELEPWSPPTAVPIDYCIVVGWSALTQPLLTPVLQCDLLNLLHRSTSFEYVEGAKPLQIGDTLHTRSRITALTVQPTGKVIEISADIVRANQPVVVLKAEFFVRGRFEGDDNQFSSTTEPRIEISIDSTVKCELLRSRDWLLLHDGSHVFVGSTLVFDVVSHHVSDGQGNTAWVQVAGTVSRREDSGAATRIGNIYFEEEKCQGNPIMEFLARHGRSLTTRHDLEHPGATEASPMHLKAPTNSREYAMVSKDTNPIHVSDLFARYAGLPGVVVHGMHTSAIVRRILEWAVGDYDRSRFRKWEVRFEEKLFPTDRIGVSWKHVAMQDGRMVFEVQAMSETTGQILLEGEANIEQPRTAYVFCGQGSQEKGMGMSLYNSSPVAQALWDRADRFLREAYGEFLTGLLFVANRWVVLTSVGFSILEIVRENPTHLTLSFGGKKGRQIRANYLVLTKKVTQNGTCSEVCILPGLTPASRSFTFAYDKGLLYSTQFAQPALALLEMVQYEHMRSKGLTMPNVLFAGHSLGEYAALGACSNFMTFENLLSLVFYRGLKMQNALERDSNGLTDFSMMATDPSRVGKGFNEATLQCVVQLISEEMSLLLEVVNHNVRSQQYVCAGHFQALWMLGRMCDRLAEKTQIDKMTLLDLRDMILEDIPTAHTLTNNVKLERGKATIPLSGIDIPFHSTMLRGEINNYREYLRSKVKVTDIRPDEFVGRWIPNVVGKPFSLDRQYIKDVQRITKSEPLRELLDSMA